MITLMQRSSLQKALVNLCQKINEIGPWSYKLPLSFVIAGSVVQTDRLRWTADVDVIKRFSSSQKLLDNKLVRFCLASFSRVKFLCICWKVL
jgi:hypothetical protein